MRHTYVIEIRIGNWRFFRPAATSHINTRKYAREVLRMERKFKSAFKLRVAKYVAEGK